MPYVIRWPHKRALALAAAGFALLVAAQPAAASVTTADCSIPASTPVFATLGDNSLYFAVPGGTFEGDMTGWSLTGASVVSGNEPLYVDGRSDHSSLDIDPGGSAVSPTVCVSSKTPTWRFFAHAVDSTGKLRIAVQLTNRTREGRSTSRSGRCRVRTTPRGQRHPRCFWARCCRPGSTCRCVSCSPQIPRGARGRSTTCTSIHTPGADD